MAANVTSFLFLFLVFYSVKSESVYEGTRISGDKLIHKSEHVKIPFFFIRTSDTAFPKYNENSDNIISAINIIDNIENGGSAEVDYGGIGFNYANVHLRSALLSGFNFTVEIYGLEYSDENHTDYFLTEIRVTLYLRRTAAYITEGGMLQDRISMKFIFTDVTKLSYRLYLYGIPKISNVTEHFTSWFNLC